MFGSIIREARQTRNLTQTQLAAISGVEQANISAIECNRRQPSASTLHQLLTACGFTLEAHAATRTIPFPVVIDDHAGDAPVDRVDPSLTPRQRNRLLMSALEASEAVVRAKRRPR